MEVILTNNGILEYKSGLLFYKTENSSNTLPIDALKNIIINSTIEMNSNTISEIVSRGINIKIIDKNDISYISNIAKREGKLLLKQVESNIIGGVRIYIAKSIIYSAFYNMEKVLSYYGFELKDYSSLNYVETQTSLLLLEAQIRKNYYSYFKSIIMNNEFRLVKRQCHPCKDAINSLISFINSLLYNEITNLILESGLEPSIAYIHSTNNRYNSLVFDLSEIYKPILVDRVIFRLINRNQINKNGFINRDGSIVIDYKTKEIIIKEFNDGVNKTIMLGNRRMSYRSIIKKDIYMLRDYLIGKIDTLNFFRSRW